MSLFLSFAWLRPHGRTWGPGWTRWTAACAKRSLREKRELRRDSNRHVALLEQEAVFHLTDLSYHSPKDALSLEASLSLRAFPRVGAERQRVWQHPDRGRELQRVAAA